MSALAKLDRARTMLAEAGTLGGVKQVRDVAEAGAHREIHTGGALMSAHTDTELTWEFDDRESATESAVDAPASPAFDEGAWTKRGEELARRDNDVRWALADWLIEGVDSMPPNFNRHGVELVDSYAYDVAESITGLSRPHLKDLVSTARRMPASVRTDALSWTHHRHLANVKPDATDDEKRQLLAEAVAEGLSSKAFAARLDPPPPTADTSYTKALRVELPLAAYWTLCNLACEPGATVQSVAAELLAKALADPDTKFDADVARKEKDERLTERRRRHGSRMHRANRLEQFHFGEQPREP